MTIMTIRIPDDVKEAFDKAFEGRDKDAIIADLIRRAAAEARSGQDRGSAGSWRLSESFANRPSIDANTGNRDEIREIRGAVAA